MKLIYKQDLTQPTGEEGGERIAPLPPLSCSKKFLLVEEKSPEGRVQRCLYIPIDNMLVMNYITI
jgi:hypothetical protein